MTLTERAPAVAAPGQPGAADGRRGWSTRRRIELAVIMVTELVGTDVLRSRLGAARFDAVRRELDWLLRDAAEDVGGRVVKSTSDGLMIAFPSGSAALEAAVGIQEQVARRNRAAAAAAAVGARIGISMGDTLFEDGDYFGIPPIEATRLCAEAGDGEILLADPVRAVLADRRAHRLEPAGPRRLKGLPDPVIAWSTVPAPPTPRAPRFRPASPAGRWPLRRPRPGAGPLARELAAGRRR